MRETIKIKTPKSETEIELYSFITGGEKRVVMNTKDDLERQDKIFEIIISKVGEETDKAKILQAILDLHGADFDFILQKLISVLEESSFSEKKN